MRFSIFTAVTLAVFLANGSSALPTRRAAEEEVQHSVSDLLTSAYATILKSKGAKDFRAIPGGRQVNWVGETSEASQEFGNSIIFNTADIVQDRTADVGETHFADAYKNFVIAVNEALHLNGSISIDDNEELQEMAQEVSNKCEEVEELAATKREKYRKKARSRNPDGPDPSPKALDQALQTDPEWTTANAVCVEASDKLGAIKSDRYGPNFALFSLAYKNIQPFVDATVQAVEGVTMPTTKAASGDDETGLVADAGIGNAVPLYVFPSLQKTVERWQERGDDEDPEFLWDSTKETVTSSSDSEENSSSLEISIGSFSGGRTSSDKETHENSLSTAQSFKVQFGAIELIDVETGLWFDRYRVAQAVQNTQDDKELAAKAIFEKYFGTKEEPLPAAQFNEKALVAYQVSWAIKFSTEEEAKEFMESTAETHVSVPIVEYSDSKTKMSEVATMNKDNLTVEYRPKNKNAVILGYTVHKYFGN